MNMVRQGDVLLMRTTETGDEPAPKDPRGIVLAEGDSSAHHHAVVGRSVKLMKFSDPKRNERVLKIGKSGAELRVVGGGDVPRHTAIKLPAGAWMVRLQRQWSGEDEARTRVVED